MHLTALNGSGYDGGNIKAVLMDTVVTVGDGGVGVIDL